MALIKAVGSRHVMGVVRETCGGRPQGRRTGLCPGHGVTQHAGPDAQQLFRGMSHHLFPWWQSTPGHVCPCSMLMMKEMLFPLQGWGPAAISAAEQRSDPEDAS